MFQTCFDSFYEFIIFGLSCHLAILVPFLLLFLFCCFSILAKCSFAVSPRDRHLHFSVYVLVFFNGPWAIIPHSATRLHWHGLVCSFPISFEFCRVRIAKQFPRKLILLYELVYQRNSTWSALVLKNKTFKKPLSVPVKGVLAGLLGVEAIPQCPLAVPDFFT